MKKRRNKSELIVAIQTLLQKNAVETQEDIRLALEKQGLQVNQAMISRVLHKIGAIKMSTGPMMSGEDGSKKERIVYRLPVEMVAVTAKNSLAQLILSIENNENLILIQTVPGSAQLVGRLLDQQKDALAILGTVAGDDTIIVVPKTVKALKKMLKNISQILLY